MPNLFARNERVICYFDTEFGPMALILVGAIFVGSMQTVWAGEVCGPSDQPTHRVYRGDEQIQLTKGEEMGRFNMGSTVILLTPKDTIEWQDRLTVGSTVRLGEGLGDGVVETGIETEAETTGQDTRADR